MATYYKPSGNFSPISIGYLAALALTAFPILGLIYAYAIWYIPFIYINFIIAAGFGFGIGLLINTFVIGKGKVRNVMLSILFGLLGGFISLYFHWSVWVDLVMNAGESYGNERLGVTVSSSNIFQVFALALDPKSLFEIIGTVNEYGTWGIKGSTVSGVALSVIWGIETIIIVGVATFTSFGRSLQPFCETGNQWFEEQELNAFLLIENPDALTIDLASSNIENLQIIHPTTDLNKDHSIFTLYSSEYNQSYLSIENKVAKIDKDGKLDFDEDIVIEYISIDQAVKEEILNAQNKGSFIDKKDFEEETNVAPSLDSES